MAAVSRPWATLLLARGLIASAAEKALGLCLGGEVRQVCSSADMASWRIVVERFSSFEVLGVTANDGCSVLQQQLEAALPDGLPQVGCYDRNAVSEIFEERVQAFVLRGWQYRNASHRGPAPADAHLQADGSYHFRSAFFQAFQRSQCASWLRSREREGVRFRWVMFGRLDVEWRSFPSVFELEYHLPVLWLQYRSVNFLQPVPSDRMHVGRWEMMLPFLERLLGFLIGFEAFVEQRGEGLALSTCLGRPGKAKFTCPPDFGPEDLVELFLLSSNMPVRMHPGMCFDMRSSRHHFESCGLVIENNCMELEIDARAGYVIEESAKVYTHAYSSTDEYDNLLAIKLHQFLAFEEARLGFDVHVVDVGAGVGTYVSLLRQFHVSVFGLDGRRDLGDSLGEDALIHDFSRPLPRVLLYRFHWVLCLNTLEYLPKVWSIAQLRQLVLNLADLAAVGILVTIPNAAYVAGPDNESDALEVEYVVDRGLAAADFHRDTELEAEFFQEAGLLCCRSRLHRLMAFRRAEVPASQVAHMQLMSSKQARDNVGMRRRRVDVNDREKLLLVWDSAPSPGSEHSQRVVGGPALVEGVAEDWLDLQVPRERLVWGVERHGPLRHLVTILYLKLFRLVSASEARLHQDLETLEDSEGQLLRSLPSLSQLCDGWPISAVTSDLPAGGPPDSCALFLASVMLLEAISARIACFGKHGACISVRVNCDAATSLAHFALGADEKLFSLLVAFPVIHAQAQAARCLLVHVSESPWPPVSLGFVEDFSALRDVQFAPTLWGKYMFRILGLAGVRS